MICGLLYLWYYKCIILVINSLVMVDSNYFKYSVNHDHAIFITATRMKNANHETHF